MSLIIIIGAGISGLYTGKDLISKGFSNFLILEASDRTGGRINTIPFGNGTIDLGPQW